MKAIVRKKKRYLFFKIVLLIFAIYSVITLIQLFADTYNNLQIKAELKEEEKQRKQRIEEMERMQGSADNDDLVEFFARSKLDYGFPDEEHYQIIGE